MQTTYEKAYNTSWMMVNGWEAVTFNVRACADAHLALATIPGSTLSSLYAHAITYIQLLMYVLTKTFEFFLFQGITGFCAMNWSSAHLIILKLC